MTYIAIRMHKTNGLHIIRISKEDNASRIVERWQKESIYYQVHKRLPGITWQIVDAKDIVGAMIAGAKL